MPRPAAGDGEDDVEAAVEFGGGRVRGDPQLGGPRDAASGRRRSGLDRLGLARPLLDLDEDDDLAAPGDDVDLADRRPVAAGEDAIEFEAEEERGERLGPPPADFRAPPPGVRFSSPASSPASLRPRARW